MKKLYIILLLLSTCIVSAQSPNSPLKPGEQQEFVELEGYYSGGFEHSNFNVLENDALLNNRMWVWFGDSLYNTPFYDFFSNKHALHHGVYMKIQGNKRWGKRYGHMGAGDSEIVITKIIALDTTRTRWGYIMDNLISNGYYKNDDDTLFLPAIPVPKKQYSFKAKHNRAIYELQVTSSDGTTVDCLLTYSKGGIKTEERNKLMIDLYRLLRPLKFEDEYETVSEYTVEHFSLPKLLFLKKKHKGKQVVRFYLEPDKYGYQEPVTFIEVKD